MGEDQRDEAFSSTSAAAQAKDECGSQSTTVGDGQGAVEESKGSGQEGALKRGLQFAFPRREDSTRAWRGYYKP